MTRFVFCCCQWFWAELLVLYPSIALAVHIFASLSCEPMTQLVPVVVNIDWSCPEALSCNKGRFCNDSKIGTLISKWLSVENNAKLSRLEIVNKQYCGWGVLSFQSREFRFVLYRKKLWNYFVNFAIVAKSALVPSALIAKNQHVITYLPYCFIAGDIVLAMISLITLRMNAFLPNASTINSSLFWILVGKEMQINLVLPMKQWYNAQVRFRKLNS